MIRRKRRGRQSISSKTVCTLTEYPCQVTSIRIRERGRERARERARERGRARGRGRGRGRERGRGRVYRQKRLSALLHCTTRDIN